MTSRVLQREQVVDEAVTLGREQYQRQRLRKASSKVYNCTKFGLRAHVSDSKTSGLCRTYDSLDYTKKIESTDLQDIDFIRRQKITNKQTSTKTVKDTQEQNEEVSRSEKAHRSADKK